MDGFNVEKDLLRAAFVAGYFLGNGGLPNYKEEMFEAWLEEVYNG